MAKTNPAPRVGSPRDLLAAVPALCGFQPASSIVVIGTALPAREVGVVLRYDLPDPPGAGISASLAAHVAGVLGANHIKRAVAVGYGPGVLVTPVADALREHLPQEGITVGELLRVEDRRYWSYVCTDVNCCPAEGTPFDPDAHLAGLEAAPVLASRAELAASVAPVTGEEAESMDRATKAAEARLAGLAVKVGKPAPPKTALGALSAVVLETVGEVIGRYRDGGEPLSHDEAAWFALSLANPRIRDDAWSRMEPEHRQAHLRLWTDLTRLARGPYVAAPASLLAFVAWQGGDGALANVALDRALAVPDYSMALLLRMVIDSGAPPSMARLPMTPQDVAASYDALEDRDEE